MSETPPFDSRVMMITLTGTDKPPAPEPTIPKFYILKTISDKDQVIIGMPDGEVSSITKGALTEMISVNAAQVVNAHKVNVDVVSLYRRPPIDLTPPESDNIPRHGVNGGEIYLLRLRLYSGGSGRDFFYAAIDNYTKEWWVKE